MSSSSPVDRHSELELRLRAGETMFHNYNFAGYSLSSIRFENCTLLNVSFVGSYLSVSNFNGATLIDVDFSGVDVGSSRFYHAKLNGVRFVGSKLGNTQWKDAELNDVDFSGAYLVGASLANVAQFQNVRLDGARYNHDTTWPKDPKSFLGRTLDPKKYGAIDTQSSHDGTW